MSQSFKRSSQLALLLTASVLFTLSSALGSWRPIKSLVRSVFTSGIFSLPKDFIFERIHDIESGHLLISDAKMYGMCALLAQENLKNGDLEQAEKLALEAMTTAAHTKQQDNIYQAYAEGILGDILYAEEHYKDAADHYGKALKTYESHVKSATGPESIVLVAAVQLISYVALNNPEHDLLIQYSCRRALAMTEKLLGPESTDTADCMFNLATANMIKNDTGRGTEGLLLRALQIYQNDSSRQNNQSLHAKAKKGAFDVMAQMYIRRKEYQNAKKSLHRIVGMVDAGFLQGDGIIRELKTLGALYMMDNEPLRAEKYYRDALNFCNKCKSDSEIPNANCTELHQLIIEASRAEVNKNQQF